MRRQGGNGGTEVRCQGERFLVLFKVGECRISPRFLLFANFLSWRVEVFQVLSKINYSKIVSSFYYSLI